MLDTAIVCTQIISEWYVCCCTQLYWYMPRVDILEPCLDHFGRESSIATSLQSFVDRGLRIGSAARYTGQNDT